MPETFTIEVLGDSIQGKVSGIFNLEAGKTFLVEILGRARKEGVKKILIDARGITTILSTMARFELGNYMAEQQAYMIRIAILASETQVLPDRFLENVARNRGVRVKVVTTLPEAWQWLDG